MFIFTSINLDSIGIFYLIHWSLLRPFYFFSKFEIYSIFAAEWLAMASFNFFIEGYVKNV